MQYATRAASIALRSMRVDAVDGGYLARLQRERLSTLVTHARRSSPWFRAQLRSLPDEIPGLEVIPPTHKAELMDHFDDWVTDPRLRLDRIQAQFLSDLDLVGHTYLDRYHVFTTSGTTGVPAVVVHDPSSWLVLQLINRLRTVPQLTRHGAISGFLRGGLRSAAVFATGGHFGGAGLAAAAQTAHPLLHRRILVVSVLDPLGDQVAQLNSFQPVALSGYPSALVALAAEQRAGRLRIRPSILLCAGEKLSDVHRSLLETVFECHVLQGYAASEAPALSLECDSHRFHVNADWYLLEAVDLDLNPVPDGTMSDTCLVTNLSNFVQPIIRYDLGDRILVHPDPCPCGSRLPSIAVEGRTNDVIRLKSDSGSMMTLLPLALVSIIEEVEGVRTCQIVNSDESSLELRLESGNDVARMRVEEQVIAAVQAYLTRQGISACHVSVPSERPAPERSGKLQQVIGIRPRPTPVSA